MTFPEFLMALALITCAGLFGYRCIETAPPINIMPNIHNGTKIENTYVTPPKEKKR